MEIMSETPINMAQLKEELAKIKKRDKELNFRATKTEEYLNQFVTLKNPNELVEKLTKLDIPRLKENHINKIVDTLPATVKDLKVILHGNLKKIADTVNSFIEKK